MNPAAKTAISPPTLSFPKTIFAGRTTEPIKIKAEAVSQNPMKFKI